VGADLLGDLVGDGAEDDLDASAETWIHHAWYFSGT
jgi:hypothetical protein